MATFDEDEKLKPTPPRDSEVAKASEYVLKHCDQKFLEDVLRASIKIVSRWALELWYKDDKEGDLSGIVNYVMGRLDFPHGAFREMFKKGPMKVFAERSAWLRRQARKKFKEKQLALPVALDGEGKRIKRGSSRRVAYRLNEQTGQLELAI